MNTNLPVIIGIGESLLDLLVSRKQFDNARGNFVYYAKNLRANTFVISSMKFNHSYNEII